MGNFSKGFLQEFLQRFLIFNSSSGCSRDSFRGCSRKPSENTSKDYLQGLTKNFIQGSLHWVSRNFVRNPSSGYSRDSFKVYSRNPSGNSSKGSLPGFLSSHFSRDFFKDSSSAPGTHSFRESPRRIPLKILSRDSTKVFCRNSSSHSFSDSSRSFFQWMLQYLQVLLKKSLVELFKGFSLQVLVQKSLGEFKEFFPGVPQQRFLQGPPAVSIGTPSGILLVIALGTRFEVTPESFRKISLWNFSRIIFRNFYRRIFQWVFPGAPSEINSLRGIPLRNLSRDSSAFISLGTPSRIYPSKDRLL